MKIYLKNNIENQSINPIHWIRRNCKSLGAVAQAKILQPHLSIFEAKAIHCNKAVSVYGDNLPAP